MFDVLYQADREEAAGILSGIHRALAPGGLLVFREPAMRMARGAHDRAVNARHRYSRPEVLALFARTGFEPLRVTYLNTLLFPPVVLMRRVQELLHPGHAASDVTPAPAPLNAALLAVLRLERQLLRVMDLPFGVSIFAAARKTES